MVSFEIFVKAMPPSLSELKVLLSFCFAFKIPDDVAASTRYQGMCIEEPTTTYKNERRVKIIYVIASNFTEFFSPGFHLKSFYD